MDEISSSLNLRLADWAHQGAKLRLEWREDEEKSIRIEEPWAHVTIGEGAFEGQLARLGHGLQRSYIIALLQELALYDRENSPTLILAIEEPELYQHPPQARHLSDILVRLSGETAQVLVCSHSPYFVSGYHFENVRLVRRDNSSGVSEVSFATAHKISARIAECTGKAAVHPTGTRARLRQILQPHISEMFFANSIVFVEGREDVAYIKSYLELNGEWEYLRRLGCHFVPVDKKSELLRPLLVAEAAGIPCFVIFDADGDAKEAHKNLHKVDNLQLFTALGIHCEGGFPTDTIWSERAVVWPTCISEEIKAAVDAVVWQNCQDEADQAFGHAPTMKKNVMHIAEIVERLNSKGVCPVPLSELSGKLRVFAGRNSAGLDESSAPA